MNPWTDFRAFTPTHAVMVALALGAWIWAIRAARRRRGTPREQSWRRAMAAFVLVPNCAWTLYNLSPWTWRLDFSLPLQLCDLAWMAAAWSLGTGRRLPSALVYYWGIGLSTQAFVTPTVCEGPLYVHFWMFWLTHWQIIAAALVALAAFGLRPGWRDCLASMAVTAVLFVSVTALNLALATNYFFSGPEVPGTPTLIDHLGPWPLRLLWMALAVAALFVLMTLPWRARRPQP